MHNEGSDESNSDPAAWTLTCDRKELSQNNIAVRYSYVTNAVQPLCILQFAIFLMCGVRTCVEEGGLLVDLLFSTRAHLS